MTPHAGAVLTGGASRRMGTDKAFLAVRGVAMAAIVADVLAAAGCRPVWCQGGDVERLAALGLAARPDPRPGGGPLLAIAAALGGVPAGTPGLVVAACDLPELSSESVTSLLHAADSSVPAALCVGGEAQLVSWWPVDCRGALTDLVTAGVRSHRGALERFGATMVEVPPEQLRNVNVPDDLPG